MKLSVELSKVVISIPIEKGLDEDMICIRYGAEILEAVAQVLTYDHINNVTIIHEVLK